MGYIIGLIIAGLVVGALARLFHPGRDPMGLLPTFLIGVAAVIISGLLLPFGGLLRFIIAVAIGVGLVALFGRMTARRGGIARRV